MTEQPMTGFTLTIDGEPDAVAVVWEAVQDALGKLYREAARSLEREWTTNGLLTNGLLPQSTIQQPILPVRGTFQIRSRGTVPPEVVVVT